MHAEWFEYLHENVKMEVLFSSSKFLNNTYLLVTLSLFLPVIHQACIGFEFCVNK